jgi:DNA (cytosine-5)-methyltransferase 1
MKILNLYCGIGGNRKLWGDDHEITAIENVEEIAKIYQDFFPNDKVIVADAHQYLLNHYKEFDFIWSSPPCPSHSRARFWGMNRGYKPIYPDMKLYEEILLLKYYFKGDWVVENVISFYKPLLEPQKVGRHYYWSNSTITDIKSKSLSHIQNSLNLLEEYFGFVIKGKKYNGDKRVLLRNCVEPEAGKHILDCAMGLNKQKPLWAKEKKIPSTTIISKLNRNLEIKDILT